MTKAKGLSAEEVDPGHHRYCEIPNRCQGACWDIHYQEEENKETGYSNAKKIFEQLSRTFSAIEIDEFLSTTGLQILQEEGETLSQKTGEDFLMEVVIDRFAKNRKVVQALINTLNKNDINPTMTVEWEAVLEALKELE